LSFAWKNCGMSLPTTIFDFFASAMLTAFEFGMSETETSGWPQVPAPIALVCEFAEVVAVRVRDEHDIDLAQARILAAHHGGARIVEDAGAVRVLEDERAVQRAELAVEAAQRRDLHGLRKGRESERGHCGAQGCDAGRAFHAASSCCY
jgi:hypothetical protein